MTGVRWRWRPGFKSVLMLSALALVGGVTGLLLAPSSVVLALATTLVCLAWLAPTLYALRFRDRASLVKVASASDVASAGQAVAARVDDARKKGSRHEYHQEQALQRIEASIQKLQVLSQRESNSKAESIDILMVTSNGAGLGHITRLLAIADKLPDNRSCELLTMSKAYKRIVNSGRTIHYFPSSEAANEIPARWNPIFREYFRRMVEHRRPRVVVFDGTWVYSGITDVCRALNVPLVWVQRGMWKIEADEKSTQRHNAISAADYVIIPGDYAGSEYVELGAQIEPKHVGPIVGTSREDLFSRNEACARLGLDPQGHYVLLNLGGGVLGDSSPLVDDAVRELCEVAPSYTPVQVVSPLAGQPERVHGVISVQSFPIMPMSRAFDFMIAAAGYNTAQEAVSLGLPTIFVPNRATRTDDQKRRALELSRANLGLIAEDASTLRSAICEIASKSRRYTLLSQLNRVEPANGATEAANTLEEIVVHAAWRHAADTIEK